MLSHFRFNKVNLYLQKRLGVQSHKETNYFYYVLHQILTSVLRNRMYATKTLLVPTMTVLTVVLVIKVSLEMEQLVKVTCFSNGNIPRISPDDTNRL